MHFFLQGEPGIGKSYLLQKLLAPYQDRDMLAGFAVARIIAETGVVGFRVQNVRNGLPELNTDDRPDLEHRFLYRGSREPAILEQMICQAEEDIKSDSCKLVLLDEIGGFELACPAFTEPLRRILDSGKPCVGVWKSAANLERQSRRQELADAVLETHSRLAERLHGSGTLITMTAENRGMCEAGLQRFLERFLPPLSCSG